MHEPPPRSARDADRAGVAAVGALISPSPGSVASGTWCSVGEVILIIGMVLIAAALARGRTAAAAADGPGGSLVSPGELTSAGGALASPGQRLI